MMEANYLIFPYSQMLDYIALYKQDGESTPWADILGLEKHVQIRYIQVLQDEDASQEVASVDLIWNDSNDCVKIRKIEVECEFQGKGIGTTLLKMVIALARHYGAKSIHGKVAGKDHVWEWYPKNDFTIFDGNKLLMELDQD